MSTLEQLKDDYRKQKTGSTIERLKKLKERYGTSYFEPDDVCEILGAHSIKEKANVYSWINAQVQRKTFYKVDIGNKKYLYRVVYIPEHEGRLSKDEYRELISIYNQVAKSAKENQSKNEVHKTESYKDLAYRLHKEDKYLPIKTDENLNISEIKPEPKPKTLDTLSKIINNPGTVQISTKKEANKYFYLPIDDSIELNLKIKKNEETVTLSTKGTSIEILRKLTGILESLK